MKRIKLNGAVALGILVLFACNSNEITEQSLGTDIKLIQQTQGPTLGYSLKSGVSVLKKAGFAFKDLNKNGELDPYEDWRLPVEERAKDLASKMTQEQIAGLMLYSQHQAIPANPAGFGAGTYGGKPIHESGMPTSSLSDQQMKFLEEDNLRHVLITSVESPKVAAEWNNQVQAFVEGLGMGIPANNSSDPRHGPVASTEYNAGAGGKISMWPESLGLAATFDPKLVQRFGEVASEEYRALGIATALSPQIDLGTEPRWNRIKGTFGEDSRLSADMARAYVDGFQTSFGASEISSGWGYHSVNAMVKHWPSGGPEEGGRDGHFAYGKFAVYPGNNFAEHLIPFTEGAFKLSGPTQKATAVMPYYTISFGQDKNGELVANGYSKYLITDLLRGEYGYDGVVCTDWLVTGDEGPGPEVFAGKPWGMEEQSIAERHFKVLMAGGDQFGGNNDKIPVLEAFAMMEKEMGVEATRARIEKSAVRLLRNIFSVGLFENPYLDPELSQAKVGNPDFMEEGYQAQLKSVVLLKNEDQVLPIREKKKVFIPQKYIPSTVNWWGIRSEASWVDPVNLAIASNYFELVQNPEEAELALVFVNSPESGTGYDPADREAGGNGYVPISLQYQPYKAVLARDSSIAAGDPVVAPEVLNRSYKNKSVQTENEQDLKTILETKSKMKDKPVIVVVKAATPMVFAEFESEVQGILFHFGVQDQVVFDLLSGKNEPSALLPVQLPADMATVETQLEDVPHDMEVHVDKAGNAYDFAFGLNWSGVINDERVKTYKHK
ncbi:glycoside hydrolase family 3 N-terminal domain-containing protein [Algoriphagus sp. CAU 1675]|uniref:glycoside hydrolase family 3 protein n=1 Tax=Algoriphagus sp. CAU 1675 TaxID=3032597 RepID=UPI0023DBEB98|nr:glycoside hydrolase family 3 N-terminal domain-containing protein [Algoriphagus sp. CAU 1675]MDF2159088.1 glycoside hydrolase family 3 N-terminal domain-containing protein [Algoriphagus sp. CAU 1675]